MRKSPNPRRQERNKLKRLVNKVSNENKSKKEYVCVTERERVCVCV